MSDPPCGLTDFNCHEPNEAVRILGGVDLREDEALELTDQGLVSASDVPHSDQTDTDEHTRLWPTRNRALRA